MKAILVDSLKNVKSSVIKYFTHSLSSNYPNKFLYVKMECSMTTDFDSGWKFFGRP